MSLVPENEEYQMKKSIKVLLITSIFLLQGCGGNDGANDPVPAEVTLTGVFLDSPVVNIDYMTTGSTGAITRDYKVDPIYKTNAEGEYEYSAGETITFAIGDLTFPPVSAAGTVTPLDIAGTSDPNDLEAVNMIRLLQTLDVDGDPSNGITISQEAKGVASPLESFDIAENDFASAVDTLIKNGGQETVPTELVSAAKAVAHFEETLSGASGVTFNTIKGSWKSPNGLVIIHFLPDGRYLAMRWEQEDGSEGFEYGTYVASNGNITFTTKENNDGDAIICWEPKGVLCGVGDVPATVWSYSLTDNEISMSPVDEDTVYTLNRVEATNSPVDGLWELLDYNVLAYFTGGNKVFYVDYLQNQDTNENVFEVGSYNLNTTEAGNSVIEVSISRTYNETGLVCEQSGGSPCDEFVDAYSINNGQLILVSTDDPVEKGDRAYLNSVFDNDSPANTAKLVAQKDYEKDIADNESYGTEIEDDFRTRIETVGIYQASDLEASTVSTKFNIDEASTIVKEGDSNSRVEARLYAIYKYPDQDLYVEASVRLRDFGASTTAAYTVLTCFGSNCDDELSLEGTASFLGNFTGDHEMKISWDSSAAAFVFLVDGAEAGRIAMSDYNADSRVIDAGGYTFDPADYTGASVNAEVRNVEAGGAGFIEVHVDEVSIDGEVYDDFTAGLINEAKWGYRSKDH